MTLMKKAIRAAIFAVAVCLMAVSCTKTSTNTLALLGNWELVRWDITTDGHTETGYPTYTTILEFHSGDDYAITETSMTGTTTMTGRWYVDEDTVILTQANGSRRVYFIEETGFSKLVLSETITQDGVKSVFRYTYKAVSLK